MKTVEPHQGIPKGMFTVVSGISLQCKMSNQLSYPEFTQMQMVGLTFIDQYQF